MSDAVEAAKRADGLYTGVLAPLLLGGAMHPVRPVGPVLAADIAALHAVFKPADTGLAGRCERARSRRARLLSPIDDLPPPGRSEWLMLCALNDLLQVANPYLPGVFSPSRPLKLVAAAEQTLGLVPPPATLADCIARHATFAAVLQIARIDTTVRWWTGAATFRGEPAPKRLLAWPEVRRVRVEEVPVGIEVLLRDSVVPLPRYLDALGRLLRVSPLTDLATAGREEPPFRWSPEALSLVSLPDGARLARRVLGGLGAQADVALERAAKALEVEKSPAAPLAARFLDQRRAHAALSP